MSLSDGMPTMTMPVTPANTSGSGNGFGWGGDGAWLIILFLIFAIFGWGGNGWGGNGGNGSGAMDGYVLTSDFANIERKLDSVNNGLCDGFYAMNTGMLNGFAGVTQAVTSGFSAAELARCNQQAALMAQLNAMQMQAQQCCCDQRADTAQLRYDMAQQGCDTRNTIQTSTRDIIDNANSNSRAILDFLTQSKLQDLQSANQELRLAASQAAQNNYLISQLRPTPIPAYQSCNPWAAGTYNGCGGCGC